MAKVVQRKKLSWLERLYIPALWNGFKVTLGHFFSWKKSEVYGEANKDNKFKTTLNYPEELWTVPKGFRGAPYLVSDQGGATKCVSCQLCEFVCPPKAIRIIPPGEDGEKAHREGAEKMPKEFEIDMLRCIFCGYCEEVCPEEAIYLLKDNTLTGENREEMIYDMDKLLAMGGADTNAYRHHTQEGVNEGIKKWEGKTEEARAQPPFH